MSNQISLSTYFDTTNQRYTIHSDNEIMNAFYFIAIYRYFIFLFFLRTISLFTEFFNLFFNTLYKFMFKRRIKWVFTYKKIIFRNSSGQTWLKNNCLGQNSAKSQHIWYTICKICSKISETCCKSQGFLVSIWLYGHQMTFT